MRWTFRKTQMSFPRPTVVMGILNVTPDSFSDGGIYLDPSRAVERGLTLVGEGADILDIGGESTRPGAAYVPPEEEIRRTVPVIRELARQCAVPLSIDTRKAEVAQAAIDAGASIVNDIAANRTPDALWDLVARSGVGYVAMHMQGTPENMQEDPQYMDVVSEVAEFFRDRLARLTDAGVDPEQVVLDPGIGFGKTVEHNLSLLRHLERFCVLERPLLLGVSRKSFIGKVLGADVGSRLYGGLACTLWAVRLGAQLVRTHDVAETVQALRMHEALAP